MIFKFYFTAFFLSLPLSKQNNKNQEQWNKNNKSPM